MSVIAQIICGTGIQGDYSRWCKSKLLCSRIRQRNFHKFYLVVTARYEAGNLSFDTHLRVAASHTMP
ncbi:hypothetical protein D3C71_986210 [compost metagenome]